MFDDLGGKTALITGASSGLGAHFAHVLSKAGVRVIAAARRAEAFEHVVSGITRVGGHAKAIQLDVSRSESIIAAVAEIEEPIDILMNSAGIAREEPAFDCDERTMCWTPI